MSGISCLLTYFTETGREGAADLAGSGALLRVENAFVAYGRYLGKTFWPVRLALPYVNPDHWSWLEVGGSVVVVVSLCLLALWCGRRWPCLLVGWGWFWGTLIPVIGLTKGWGVFMGDRFTYLPSIGLLLLVVWGVCEATRGWRHQTLALLVAWGAAQGLCLAQSRRQISYWRDSETLFQHTLAVTENNCIAHNSLANALNRKGRIEEAIPHYEEAIRLKPDYAEAYNNLGSALDDRGQSDQAILQYQVALRLKPDYADAYYNLGNALRRKGQTDEAIGSYQEALRLKPDYAEAHNNLGIALYRQGRTAEAIRQFEEALRLKPKFAGARENLDAVLTAKARLLSSPGAATHR